MQRKHDARKHGEISENMQNKVSMSDNGIFARDFPRKRTTCVKTTSDRGVKRLHERLWGRIHRSRRIGKVSAPGGRRKVSEIRRCHDGHEDGEKWYFLSGGNSFRNATEFSNKKGKH